MSIRVTFDTEHGVFLMGGQLASPAEVAAAIAGYQSSGAAARDQAEVAALLDQADVARLRSQASWTQPICAGCWTEAHPDLPPVHVTRGDLERCCQCGVPTTVGIYVRRDPATVPFPSAY